MRHFLMTTLAATGLALAGCQTVPSAHPLPEACSQSPEAGSGEAGTTGYYYDQDSYRCHSVTYGDGGSAPFQDLGQCMAACYAPAPNLMPDNADTTSARTEQVR